VGKNPGYKIHIGDDRKAGRGRMSPRDNKFCSLVRGRCRTVVPLGCRARLGASTSEARADSTSSATIPLATVPITATTDSVMTSTPSVKYPRQMGSRRASVRPPSGRRLQRSGPRPTSTTVVRSKGRGIMSVAAEAAADCTRLPVMCASLFFDKDTCVVVCVLRVYVCVCQEQPACLTARLCVCTA